MDSTTQLQYRMSRNHLSGRVRLVRVTTGKKKNHGTLGVNPAWKGARTKTFVLAFALGTFAQAALAAEPNCRAIESTGARLACYDAAFPPKPKEPQAIDNGAPRAEYKDPLIAEDARIAAKLKNICRGC